MAFHVSTWRLGLWLSLDGCGFAGTGLGKARTSLASGYSWLRCKRKNAKVMARESLFLFIRQPDTAITYKSKDQRAWEVVLIFRRKG